MKKYLHIGINWNGPPQTAEIHKLILFPGVVDDWFSYGGNCWIVFTQYNQSQWADYLAPHIGTGAALIIHEVVNLHQTNGFLPPGLWEWFNRLRYDT